MTELILKPALMALFSFAALLLLMKLQSNRQVMQMSLFDYVNGITIGSIAAELATSSFGPEMTAPLIALVVYSLCAVLISWLTDISLPLRRFFEGTAIVLMEGGTIYYANLKRARIDVNEMMSQLRTQGWFDLADLQTVVLEANGRISALPLAGKRPLTPSDQGLSPAQEKPPVAVISDGKVLPGNLRFTGHDEKWLRDELHRQGYAAPEQILLALVTGQNSLSLFTREKAPEDRDIFL